MDLKDWKIPKLGEDSWNKKYRREGETFEHWLDRVSGGDNEVKQLIIDKKFLFGGRILASRGITDRKVTYSNCYVLPKVEDSIEGIYDTAKILARTFSYGGGCGIDISNLRPKGSPVNNAALTTSGAVSFMDTFSQVATTIGQEGRRGALMISMDCKHPDIKEFIDAKKNTDKLDGCNISVRVSDSFMSFLERGDKYEREIFNKIVENNYDYAEPGLLYWDTINDNNMLSEYIKSKEFEYAGVNPCAEEPLPAGGSCLLGAINLSEFIENPFTDKAAFNIPEFKRVVKIAVRALNTVLDEGLELHPLQIQRGVARDWRQIGLGIMGFADALIKLGIRYGSPRCVKLIDTIGETLVTTGVLTSIELAKEFGAFPKCDIDKIVNSNFIKNTIKDVNVLNKLKKYGIRNSQLFTIAPTGTISNVIGVSGGVEPVFDYIYDRTTKSLHGKDVTYTIITPIIEQALSRYKINSKNIDKISLPKEITWSKMIEPRDRILTQATWQKYIDASISSTVNLPEYTTKEDIYNLYILAWKLGCKGMTIYREGCKREGILNTKNKKSEKHFEQNKKEFTSDTSIDNCIAHGSKINTGCGSLWITVYFHRETGQLCHIFLNKGSTGGCNSFMVGLSRMISLAGRGGATIDDIVDQLNSTIACPSYIVAKKLNDNTSKGNCCPSAIGYEIKRLYNIHMKELESPVAVVDEVKEGKKVVENPCPECGHELQMTGGCNICPSCGWSRCE